MGYMRSAERRKENVFEMKSLRSLGYEWIKLGIKRCVGEQE